MKLLHKQLLLVCLPFVMLAIVSWIVCSFFIEPFERKRLRAEARQELEIQAAFIRQGVQRATNELRTLTDSPAFRSDDLNLVQAEVKRLSALHAESFAALHYHDLAVQVPGARSVAVLPDDERVLRTGKVVVSELRNVPPANTPTIVILVPGGDADGEPRFALAGELPLASLFPMLDPSVVDHMGDYTLIDAMGREMTAARLKSVTPLNPRTAWTSDEYSHGERVSVSIAPWNWKISKFITWRMATGALRFQRELLIILTLCCLALAAATTVWVNRATARRLAKLTEQMQIFGATDQTIRSTDLAADEFGRLVETFNCMADDVSHAQRRLQKQLAEHQHSPGQRTEQVAELQGRVADLERFAAHLAHEFNGPLVTLEGFAANLSAAAKTESWDRFHEDLARVQTIGRQLRDVVEVLLKLAKRETSKPLSQSAALHRAATEAKALLPPSPRGENIVIAADLPTVPGDPVLWRHLFLNLLQNAIKACAETGSPRIEIGWERRNADVVCHVRDNGRGISPADLERIFQGPDIGLRLVRQIVELHGGKVWAESKGPGTGTTVWWTVISR